jgi:hypothetical protein
VAKPLGVAQQRLCVSKQVMSDSNGLRALKVCVAGHYPGGMGAGFGGKGLGRAGDFAYEGARGGPAVEAQVEGHLVVARAARVQGSAGGRDLRQPPLDCGVDVLIGFEEGELAFVELAPDPPQASLDRCQLPCREKLRRRQAASVRDAARDVERIKVVVDIERRREEFQLGQQAAGEPTAPKLAAGFLGYGVSLLTSPSRFPSSRACSRPCTCADVLTPSPHSLMKPSAADWSKESPCP